ncbi:MAG: helix-turn-helix transcriptional regulator [Candidatus Eremiobacteraeota bacterium]|nr:helix-turn-helix transcriptional regulator [Candidatus Eremiobacteraeota bacterium]
MPISFSLVNMAMVELTQPDALSDIEREVLTHYARGLTRAEIAQQTGLSANTIGHYLTTAKDKLHARSLAHAVFILCRSN